MGLSVVIYQALIYVGIFFVLFLSASFLVNKIREKNPDSNRRKKRILKNHMEPIQTRIKQAEQHHTSHHSQHNRSRSSGFAREYFDNHRWNRSRNTEEIRAQKHYFSSQSLGYREQFTHNSSSYNSSSEVVTFR